MDKNIRRKERGVKKDEEGEGREREEGRKEDRPKRHMGKRRK